VEVQGSHNASGEIFMKKNLAHNAAYNIIYRLLNVVFPLISATYLARVLSPEGVGRVAYAQNIVSYFLMFALMGIPEYGTREIAKARNSSSQTNQLFTELLVINFASTAVMCGVYYLFAVTWLPGDRQLYKILGLELFFNFLNIDWLYQGKEEYAYITIRSILVKILSLAALLFFVRKQEDYLIYAVILCLGTGCNYIYNILHARKLVRLSFRGLNVHRHLRPVFTLLLSTAAASLYNKVDITMLGWISTEASVGYYTNAFKLITIVLTLVTALAAVFLPRLSYVYQTDKNLYNEYLSIGLKVTLTLAVPCFIGLLLTAEDLIIVMFGEAFAPAASVIKILAVFTIIRGAGDLLCYQAIISSGNEHMLIKSRIIAGIANIVLNAIWIPRFSHAGAAWASLVSELIVNGVLLRYTLTFTKPRLSKSFVASLGVSTAVMAGAVLFSQQFWNNRIITLGVSVTIGVVSYFLMLVITKNEMLQMIKLRGQSKG